MRSAPEGIASEISAHLFQTHGAVCLRLNERGVLQESWGPLERFGLEGLAPGREATEQIDCLAGMWPPQPGEDVVLPCVCTASDRHADVHLLQRGEDQAFVLFLDVEDQVREDRAGQQLRNELALRLERETLERAAEEELLGVFDAVLFQTRPAWKQVGPTPHWLPEQKGRTWPEALGAWSLFLESFLLDAEEHWNSRRPGILPSGAWVQSLAEGGAGAPLGSGDEDFEAFAIRTRGGMRYLAVARQTKIVAERRRLLQRARHQALQRESLEREVQRRELLLHSIVHDLRSPLASIVGSLSLLAKQRTDAERTQTLIMLALEESRRQERMIRGLLEVFTAEVEELERVEHDPRTAPQPAHVLELVVERQLPAYLDAGVGLSLSVDPDATELRVAGSSERLERIVANLVENALRYSPEGSTVEIRLAREGEDGRIEVLDRGPGVEPALRERLFQRFASGVERSSFSGVGLHFCRATLERWGGAIGYQDRPGGGACFWMRLAHIGSSS